MQDNSLSNAHMRLCHLLPRVKRRHGKLAQDSWELWSLSAYFVAGAVERHKVTGFVRDFRGVQLVLNQTRLAAISFMILWQLGPTVVSRAPPKESLPCQAWVCSDTPTVTVCQTKESPVKSSSTSRQQNAAVNIEVCWKPGQAASRFPETLKKKRPNYMRTAEESKHSAHRVHRHRSSQRLYKRLTVDPQSTAFLYKLQSAPDRLPVTSVTSSSCWESSVPCRPDLPPSLRNPEVDASTWSHASVRSMYAAIMVYIVCVLFNYIYI